MENTLSYKNSVSPGVLDILVVDDEPTIRQPLEYVLRPFYTTKTGHLGLGLNIAKRVFQRLGGDLVIASVPTAQTRGLYSLRRSHQPAWLGLYWLVLNERAPARPTSLDDTNFINVGY